jgi:hypothetical protein
MAHVRVAVVALLLAVTAAGLRSRGAFSHAAHAAAGISGSALGVVLGTAEGIAIVAFLLVLVMARPRLHRRDDEEEYVNVIPWWLKLAGVLLALALAATPLVLLAKARKQATRRTPLGTLGGHPPGSGSGRTGVALPPSDDLVPILVGVGLALIAVIALLLYIRHRSRGGPLDPADRARRQLAGHLTNASGALLAAADPRTAIIACYAALEHSFAEAGSAPSAADTPAEVLARAAGAGLVRSGSADVLTGLFRRARYSTQPMTRADSGAAADALARMHEDLACDA